MTMTRRNPSEPLLNYWTRGPADGETVVFLHAVGIDASMWETFLPFMPAIRAVFIDLPGHGGSRDIPWASLEDTATRVADVVNSLRGEGDRRDVHLVAISLGSYVGLTMLARHTEMFKTAFLSGMHAGGMKNRWLMRIMSFFMAPLAVRPFFARRTAAMFGVGADDVDAFVAGAVKTRSSAFRRATNDVVAFELPAGVGQIRTKTLFVAGSKEHKLIVDALGILADALPNARALTIDGGGHGWPGAMPDAFARHVLEWAAGD
ncbi:MAG: alpha/beta hydrolase [Pseudomonadota bacterium]